MRHPPIFSSLPLLAAFTLALPSPSTAASSSSSSTSSLPQINFNSLGSVTIVGPFSGLSLYDPSSPPHSFSPTASTLIARSSSSDFTTLGATNTGGSIHSLCATADNSQLFVGGSFTSIGSIQASNIAVWSISNNSFSPLGSGLDGPVTSLDCSDNSTLYVGGTFANPLDPDNTGKNLAAWNVPVKAWQNLPLGFEGVNGPVESLSRSNDGKSLFIGGTFSTSFTSSSTSTNSTTAPGTIDVTTTTTTSNPNSTSSTSLYSSLGSSLSTISLNSSDVWASPTSYISGFGLPSHLYCPKGPDGVGSSWLLVDGADGFIISRFNRPLVVKGVRLGNTFFGGRGTKNFSFVSIPDNTVQTLQFTSDPSDPTSSIETCSANCVLSHNSSIPYTDFLFPTSLTLTGFQLNIFGFYGPGAGLHLLQLLSDGAYASAVGENNLSPCTSGLGASSQSQVSVTNGNWTQTTVVSGAISGTVQKVLEANVVGGTSVADGPVLTWEPTVVQDGQYEIFITTPGCQEQGDCPQRTLASVSVIPGAVGVGAETTTTIVNQDTAGDLVTSIFNGTLFAETGVRITIGLAEGGAPNVGQAYHLVADFINTVAASSFGGGTNSTLTTTTYLNGTTLNSTTVTNTSVVGSGLFELPLVTSPSTTTFGSPSSITNATFIDVLAASFLSTPTPNITSTLYSSSTLFLGGTFSFHNNTISSTNFLSYSTSGGIVSPNGGLSGGQVLSLVDVGGYIYAAGTFTSTTDGTIKNLQGFARWQYSVAGTSWQQVGGSTLPSSIAGLIDQLAVVPSTSSSSNSTIVAVGSGGTGLAFFDTTSAIWNSTELSGLFVGNLSAVTTSTSKAATTYMAGNIAALADEKAPGGAILKSSGGVTSLSPLGFSLQSSGASSTNSSSGGVGTTKLKRGEKERDAAERRRSLVAATSAARGSSLLSERDTVSSSFANSSSEILAGAYWKNGSTSYLILGGKFVSSTGVENLGLYNLDNQTMVALKGEVVEGTVDVVTVVGDEVWYGGNFTTASGRTGLGMFDLEHGVVDTTAPALTGSTGSPATVSVIAQRPGFATEIVVAGSFAAAAALPCQSICWWDTKALQWTAFGEGLQGTVDAVSFAGGKSEFLLAAGSFAINGTTTYLAVWSYNTGSWSLLGSATDIPGPATAVSADGTNDAKIFLAGQTATTSQPYLLYWNGTAWTDINSSGALETGSGIEQLVFVPLSQDHSANSIIESDRMLMASGELNINSSTVGSALFDGVQWHPYIVATGASGSGAVSSFFYSVTNFTLAGKHLSVGIVILISIAIALGVVFLVVLIGLIIALARRSEESAYPVSEKRDGSDKVHVLHRPTSLLTTVGAATAVMLDSKGEKANRGVDHDSIAGPLSFDGAMSYESHGMDDSVTRARYSFHAEHAGELSVSAGADVNILDSSDPNWWLIADSSGQRGLVPASYLC